jgi:hypothetical protein
MSKERKISDDELVEISGGADGPVIELDRAKLDDDQDEGPSFGKEDSTPGGPGVPPDTTGGGGGGSSHMGD